MLLLFSLQYGSVNEIGRCFGMEMKVEKAKVMRISSQPSPVTILIDQLQLENMECFKYLCSILTNDGRCTCEIISLITDKNNRHCTRRSIYIFL